MATASKDKPQRTGSYKAYECYYMLISIITYLQSYFRANLYLFCRLLKKKNYYVYRGTHSRYAKYIPIVMKNIRIKSYMPLRCLIYSVFAFFKKIYKTIIVTVLIQRILIIF